MLDYLGEKKWYNLSPVLEEQMMLTASPSSNGPATLSTNFPEESNTSGGSGGTARKGIGDIPK